MINIWFLIAGLAGSFIFATTTLILLKTFKVVHWRRPTISDLGRTPGAWPFFNIAIIVFSLCQLAFIFQLFSFYGLLNDTSLSLLLFVPPLMFLTIPIFNVKYMPRVHFLLAVVGFTLMFVGGMLFNSVQLAIAPWPAALCLVVDLVVLFVIVKSLLINHEVCKREEMWIFWGVFVWNCINAAPLLFSHT